MHGHFNLLYYFHFTHCEQEFSFSYCLCMGSIYDHFTTDVNTYFVLRNVAEQMFG
jgi:hypothetical protein